MILDVGPLLRGETDCIKIDYMLTPEKLDGVTFTGDAHVLGTITDNAGYMRLTLRAELSYSSECARCLAPVDGVFSLDFERTVASEGTLSDEQLEEHFDEYAILNGTMLDTREPSLAVLAEFMQMKPLPPLERNAPSRKSSWPPVPESWRLPPDSAFS